MAGALFAAPKAAGIYILLSRFTVSFLAAAPNAEGISIFEVLGETDLTGLAAPKQSGISNFLESKLCYLFNFGLSASLIPDFFSNIALRF